MLCESLGADAIGFIFYNKSKRFIDPVEVRKITSALSVFTAKVGVFVNAQPHEINQISEIAGLNVVQLHGDETPDICNKLFLPSINAFRVHHDFDFSIIPSYGSKNFILDSYSTSEYGGTGKPFDWSLIPQSLLQKSIIAGGVSEDNIEDIYHRLKPYGVDVSSSIEVSPGVKSKAKTESFFNKIRSMSC